MAVRFERLTSGQVASASGAQETEAIQFLGTPGTDRAAFAVIYLKQLASTTITVWPTISHANCTWTKLDSHTVQESTYQIGTAVYGSTSSLDQNATSPTPATITTGTTQDLAWDLFVATGCDKGDNGNTPGMTTTSKSNGDLTPLIIASTASPLSDYGDGMIFGVRYELPEATVTWRSLWDKNGNASSPQGGSVTKWNYGVDPAQDVGWIAPVTATADIPHESNAWVWVSVEVDAEQVDHELGALPPLQSDVPFLVSNDRYQVVAVPYRGTTTTTPEFRYWYANAPNWDDLLNGDTHSPLVFGLDEWGYYTPGVLELPYKDLKVPQEAHVKGIVIEFVPHPATITSDLDGAFVPTGLAQSVGFSGRVEGHGVIDWERIVSTTSTFSTTSGTAVSDTFSYASTVGAGADDTWPNVRAVKLPVRLQARVRAVRVIFTDVHLCRIRRVHVIGTNVATEWT